MQFHFLLLDSELVVHQQLSMLQLVVLDHQVSPTGIHPTIQGHHLGALELTFFSISLEDIHLNAFSTKEYL